MANTTCQDCGESPAFGPACMKRHYPGGLPVLGGYELEDDREHSHIDAHPARFSSDSDRDTSW